MKKYLNILWFSFFLWFSGGEIVAETQVLDYIKIIVNDEIMTNNEVQDAMVALRTQIIHAVPEGEERDQQLARLEETVIENLVSEMLVLDRAKSLKIGVSDDEIEQHINRLAQQNPQITTIYDPEELKQLVSRDFLKQRVISQEVRANVHVAESEVTALCEKTIEQTKEVEIAHILFRGSEAEARQKSERVKDALAQGTAFEELAKLHSEDPNAKDTGGKLGRFQKGRLLPVIDEVAFSLKKQELSQLVKTEIGYHLLYVHDIVYPGGACDNLSAEQQTRYNNLLFEQKHQEEMKSYLEKLRKAAQIVIH